MEIRPIAHIRTEFPEKFGIPRQSGLAEHLVGKIVFEEEFRNQDAFRGLEDFSHLWLIWEFSANKHDARQPTVRPPRLGGNAHMGVFATRSPYRPNPLGLSCVEISSIDMQTPEGPIIYVKGADLMDGTPIYDIKPYLPFSDIHTDATSGFAEDITQKKLEVIIPEHLESIVSKETMAIIMSILKEDPRPGFHNDNQRIYVFSFENMEIKFKVDGDNLYVVDIIK